MWSETTFLRLSHQDESAWDRHFGDLDRLANKPDGVFDKAVYASANVIILALNCDATNDW